MKTWTRAAGEMICGGDCDVRIQSGEPVLLLTLPGVTSVKRRCVRCAGEAPPVNLPLPELRPEPEPLPFTRFSVGTLPLDWKHAQAGERDPGAGRLAMRGDFDEDELDDLHDAPRCSACGADLETEEHDWDCHDWDCPYAGGRRRRRR